MFDNVYCHCGTFYIIHDTISECKYVFTTLYNRTHVQNGGVRKVYLIWLTLKRLLSISIVCTYTHISPDRPVLGNK